MSFRAVGNCYYGHPHCTLLIVNVSHQVSYKDPSVVSQCGSLSVFSTNSQGKHRPTILICYRLHSDGST